MISPVLFLILKRTRRFFAGFTFELLNIAAENFTFEPGSIGLLKYESSLALTEKSGPAEPVFCAGILIVAVLFSSSPSAS